MQCGTLEPVLPAGVMSGSVALNQQRSATTKGQVDSPGLVCFTVDDMLMSESCTELAQHINWAPGRAGPPGMRAEELTYYLATCSTLESSPHILEVACELTLNDRSVGELAVPLISHAVAWTKKRYLHSLSTLTTFKRQKM